VNGVSEEFLTELKARNDIVDVIAGYISLKRNGEDYWACCPFHHEKTPSFVVHRRDQYYHCFGCGASGTVINFVQKYESLDFMDAVRLLAKRAGIEVPVQSGADAEEAIKRKKQKDEAEKIMLATARFYRDNLYSGKAEKHVEYLINRGIQPSTIKKFGFGASLDFSSLPAYLSDLGFSREDILRAGVCSPNKKSGGLYDFEAERVIVPIINAMDEVIAFGGRLLDVKSGMGKYKNTRETILFNKSRTLFNLNMIKRLKQEKRIDNLIMVEGYMDAITLYQAGFKNVVASMGTSLTPDQARMVKRYSENVLVSYDGDAAGQHANLRGMEIFKKAGLNVKVVPLPKGEDPDDVIRNRGAEFYQDCLNKAMPLIDYKIYSLDNSYDITVSEGKREYVNEALKIIRAESESTLKEELIQNLSRRTGYSVKALNDDLSLAPAPPSEEGDKAAEKEAPSPEWAKGLPRNVVESTRFLLAAKLFNMPYAKDYKLNPDMFLSDVQRRIAEFIVRCEESGRKIRAGDLIDEIPEDDKELGAIFDLYVGDKLLGANSDRYFADCIKVMNGDMLKARIAYVNGQIEACTDKDERRALMEQLSSLTKLLKK